MVKSLIGHGFLVHEDAHVVEDHGRRHLHHNTAALLQAHIRALIAVTQLQRSGQVGIAPRAGFGLIAQLLQRIRRTAGGQLRW